jgi:hypothetical protein
MHLWTRPDFRQLHENRLTDRDAEESGRTQSHTQVNTDTHRAC